MPSQRAAPVGGPMLLMIGIALVVAARAEAQPYLADRFGRPLDAVGLTLVDWEGQIANPLITFKLSPPAGASFPVTATLSANQVRLYFDTPSSVSPVGPQKSLTFFSAAPQNFRLSIFPDRDASAEMHALSVQFVDAASTITNVNAAIHVIDQDSAAAGPFQVMTDFSQDGGGFFANAARRGIVNQVAADWAYFIADMDLDPVAAGDESSFIWSYPLAWTGPPPQGTFINNGSPFSDFLLYAYAVNTPENRSGGAPGNCCFHSSGGGSLPLRRSGGIQMEEEGNFNTLGWFLTASDGDWWVSGNQGFESNDFYSIAHHECGHALGFNSDYPLFADGESFGFLTQGLLDYFGGPIFSDAFDHFDGVIDPASGQGVFGNEYFGDIPRRRWLITKLDLLLLESVGYSLRPTSPFIPLTIQPDPLPAGSIGAPYAAQVGGIGGVPAYRWSVTFGELPPGLTLNSFNGQISGTPTDAGTFNFELALEDALGGVALEGGFFIQIGACTLGDVNADGLVNGGDVQGFVRVKLTGSGSTGELCAAGLSNPAFVALLLGS